MFRFVELSLHGWDYWQQFRVQLHRDVILLSGPNGSGKTTFLDSIRQLLGAPRLSSRRRLQHYLRRPEQPSLIRAVVTNDAPEGSQQPFRKERITTPEVTLACALVPSSGGAPEKRFAILPGRASAADLQQRLLDSKDFYAPERYARALENAGVSRSLMAVLAIEQGKTNTLFELSPRELFRRVLEMLGDKAVLDRYTDARRRFAHAEQDLNRQISGLLQQQAALEAVKRKVRELDEWEEAQAKVAELEARLPAARYQSLFKKRQEIERTLRELRTKVRLGETQILLLQQAFEQARTVAEHAQRELTRAAEEMAGATSAWNQAHGEAKSAADRVADLEEREVECRNLPAADAKALEAQHEKAVRAALLATGKREELDARAAELEHRIEKLKSGVHAYPERVTATLTALGTAQIEATMLCREISSVSETVAAALESALGDARFALLVAEKDHNAVFEIASSHGFPGPVFAGDRIGKSTAAGAARLEAGAPTWLPELLERTHLSVDGSYRDEKGRWVGGKPDRFVGATAIEASLRTALEDLDRVRAEQKSAVETEKVAQAAQPQAAQAVAGEHRRQFLLEQLAELPRLKTEAARLAEVAQAKKTSYDAQAVHHAQANSAWLQASTALKATTEERDTFERQLHGERTSITEHDQQLTQTDGDVALVRDSLSLELRTRAEAGQLDGPETVEADLERARARLKDLPVPPGPEIRLEAKHVELNIQELERHVAERTKEKERADEELLACRQRYLEVINYTLAEYKGRAIQLGRGADVVVEMDLPPLRNDEQAIDEATIDARFAFDGKDTLPLGDSSFSGGQQVIAGLILLMSMAETEGGFFMLDEPFAHLSIDRIDQVGHFLRSSKAQFLITAPTTLDRAQLDPASMVIVLQKKAKGATYAPSPMVAIA